MHLTSKFRMLKRLILMDEGCFFLTQKPPISGSETILEARLLCKLKLNKRRWETFCCKQVFSFTP